MKIIYKNKVVLFFAIAFASALPASQIFAAPFNATGCSSGTNCDISIDLFSGSFEGIAYNGTSNLISGFNSISVEGNGTNTLSFSNQTLTTNSIEGDGQTSGNARFSFSQTSLTAANFTGGTDAGYTLVTIHL